VSLILNGNNGSRDSGAGIRDSEKEAGIPARRDRPGKQTRGTAAGCRGRAGGEPLTAENAENAEEGLGGKKPTATAGTGNRQWGTGNCL